MAGSFLYAGIRVRFGDYTTDEEIGLFFPYSGSWATRSRICNIEYTDDQLAHAKAGPEPRLCIKDMQRCVYRCTDLADMKSTRIREKVYTFDMHSARYFKHQRSATGQK